MRIRTREAIAGFIFTMPSLAGFALLYAIPFIGSLYYCFTEGIGGVRFVGLRNFKSLLESKSFALASLNSLRFNIISVPLIIIISLLFALLLNNKIKGAATFRTFFIVPLVIPVASIILFWHVFFNQYGVLNHVLGGLGAAPVDWMESSWSVGVLMVVYIWKNCGYNVVLFLAGLNSIPPEYYENARIDGAGPFVCFRRITIPFLIPTSFFVFIISIINSFKVFREAYLLAGSYPYLDMYMLQHFMNNNFFNLSYQRLTTSAFLMAAAISALVYVLFKMEGRFGKSIV